MNTIREIEASLPSLSTDHLHHIERMIHDLYRARHEPVIYDDAYGIWTECDQISAASEVFEILDKQEDIKHNADAFLIMFCGLWRVLVGWTPFGKLPPQLNLVLRSLTIGQSFADLGDYLYRMPEINFDVDIKRKAYLIALDTELADKLMVIARSRHTSPEVLINAWRKFWSL